MGYVPEHRLVAEKTIGRFINPVKEDVHHLDENVTNNSSDNLIVLTKKAHRRIHNGWAIIEGVWWKKCPKCLKFLEVESNFYHRYGRVGFYKGSAEYVSICKHCSIIKSAEQWEHRYARA
jgi:hypothetical protein